MEVLERPAGADSQIEDEFSRFKGVVAARRFPSDFIALFDKLRTSEMFSDAVKPQCFAHMLDMSPSKVPDHFVEKMVDALEQSSAVPLMYAEMGAGAERALSGLVRRLFETAPLENKPLLDLFLRLERMGVSQERGMTLALALEAGADPDRLGRICDLTFFDYYPGMPRPKPKEDLFANDDSI